MEHKVEQIEKSARVDNFTNDILGALADLICYCLVADVEGPVINEVIRVLAIAESTNQIS